MWLAGIFAFDVVIDRALFDSFTPNFRENPQLGELDCLPSVWIVVLD